MNIEIRERAGCSWLSEAAHDQRRRFPDSAIYHDGHGDDLRACDSWLCVCGKTDLHGGSWETCDAAGAAIEPVSPWAGHVRCTACDRVYDGDGLVVRRGTF